MVRQTIWTALILLYAFSASFTVSAAPAGRKAFHVVIDPGHGGVDQGTIYEDERIRITEKEVTLALAQEAAREIRARGIQVTLTRERDEDVSLGRRTALANKLKADVFVSIHMNSTAGREATELRTAQGIETYILNNTTDATSRRLAKLENTVLGQEAKSGTQEQVDVALILRDLTLDANLAESKRLACSVQSALVAGGSRANRGIKQALFHVLLGAEMPSVLLEAGFLTHAKDRAWVLSTAGKRSIGASIAKAMDQFRKLKGTRQALSELSRCKVN